MVNFFTFFIVFLSTFHAFSITLNGIAVEGCDYAGKSTIVTELQRQLKGDIPLKLNHRFISDNKSIIDLGKKAWDSLPKDIPSRFPDDQFFSNFNEIMTQCFSQDLKSYQHPKDNSALILQDRCWISQACMNLYFTPDLQNRTFTITHNLYIPFEYNIYLYCSPEARIQRARNRDIVKTPDSIDKYFVKQAKSLVEFDSYCIDFVKERTKKYKEQWLVIDTTNLTKEETAKKILKFIR